MPHPLTPLPVHTVIRDAPLRAGDPAELISNNAAILATIDWTPKRDDLEGIVRDALAWERRLGELGR